MNTFNPGDVHIDNLTLIHPEGRMNLLGYVMDINIYESLKAPTITADMTVFDGTGLLDNVMLADARVLIEFTTFMSVPSRFEFVISQVYGAMPGNMSQNKQYKVLMVSDDMIKSASMLMTENFIDMNHETMINNILRGTLKSSKNFGFEKTRGLDFIQAVKMHPFQAIDLIRRRCVGMSSTTSSYCFFENKAGYNLLTMEKIIKDGKADPSVATGDRNFTFQSSGKTATKYTDWRNIVGLQQINTQNLTQTLGMGGVRNVAWSYNMMTGEYQRNDFNANQDAVGGFSVSRATTARFADTEARNVMYAVNSAQDQSRVEKASMVTPYILKMLSNMLNIHIYGDSVLTAGSVINVSMPVLDGLSGVRKNKLLSGAYVITKLRHMLTVTGSPKYMQACEVLKEGFGNE